MTFTDLALVQFHKRADGSWSYAVYCDGSGMWRSNTRQADPMECLDEIMQEMLSDETEKRLNAELEARSLARAKCASQKPPAGTLNDPQNVSRHLRANRASGQTSGLTHAAPPPKPAKARRRASRRG